MYTLLTPVEINKPDKSSVQINPIVDLTAVSPGTFVAVDIETKGTQAADPTTYIVGVGLAFNDSILYYDLESINDNQRVELLQFLRRPDLFLIGHNVFFDAAFLQRDNGYWLPGWGACTYGMFKQLANEGFLGQRWGLKDAQINLLGWTDKGDEELNKWQVENNLVKNQKTYASWSIEERLTGYEAGNVRPDKGLMYLAPREILGYYCGLDAYSTLKLFTDVLMASLKRMPANWQEVFFNYHTVHMTNIKLLVEQQLKGVQVNKNKLIKLKAKQLDLIQELEDKIYHTPAVRKYIDEYKQTKLNELLAKEPIKHKKLPILGKEPAKFKKDGITKNPTREKWLIKAQLIEDLGPGEVTQSWLNWVDKYNAMLRNDVINSEGIFNIYSGKQRRWLLYDKLKYPMKITTPSGLGATDKKALPAMGEIGKILNKLDKNLKLVKFIESLESVLIEDRIHPQFRVPGTLTCRLGGSGGFNLQNIPKHAGFAAAFEARPGHVWVDLDFASLEQVVLAELSQDPTLLTLYGPGAKDNDVYLYNGSNLPIIGPIIRATGYDPLNPTAETIKLAKEKCKKERQIAKQITLASAYGAGAKKIQASLELEGIHISVNEAMSMHKAYWKLYAGVKDFEAYWSDYYDESRGIVLNGIGRVVCCDIDYKKDLVNRIVQSTGHDLLMFYISILEQLRQATGIKMYPIFLDTHDATTWECRIEDAEKVKQLFERAMVILNEQMGGLVKLKGDAGIVHNLAEAKGLKQDD